MSRPTRRTEEGSALVLVLVFLTIFGLFVASLLTFANTSILATESTRSQRSDVYSADGAVNASINAIRANTTLGVDGGTPCPDFNLNGVNSIDVAVHCKALLGSGVAAPSSGAAAHGIISVGTPAPGCGTGHPFVACEDGITLAANDVLRVGGGVSSKSTIKIPGSNARLNACPPNYPSTVCDIATASPQGTVDAAGACDSGKIIAYSVKCNGTGTPAADPGNASANEYDPPAGEVFAPQTAPSPSTACPTGSDAFVVLNPGVYQDAGALSALMDPAAGHGHSAPSCTRTTFWFTPGDYHFDFPSGNDQWDINDPNVTIVGGVPLGWNPLTPPAQPSLPTSGNCDSSQSGVEFMFGRDSRINLRAGTVELCARDGRNGGPRIAIDGIRTTSAPFAAPASTGCIRTAPYDGVSPGRCALITADGNFSNLSIKGTIYAPLAPIDVNLPGQSAQFISPSCDLAATPDCVGLVARTIIIGVPPSTTFTGAFVSSPGTGPPSPPGPRDVVFWADISGTTKLRARVRFTDGVNDCPPTPGTAHAGTVPIVCSWSVLR